MCGSSVHWCMWGCLFAWLVLHVFWVGFSCILAVIGASIGGTQSWWMRMFFGVVGVAISGWAWGLRGEHVTSYCFDIYTFFPFSMNL